MSAPGESLVIAAATVGIAGAIGYGLFRLASPRGHAETPTQMGRKWFAWMALISTVTLLPKFIRTFAIDPFAVWLINLVVLGGLAFALGWLYGKLKGLKPAKGPVPAGITIATPVTSKPSVDTISNESTAAPSSSTERRLDELSELLGKGLITKDEYDKQRKRIIDAL